MADLTATSLFNPNPLTNGGTFIQGWQDYINDNGSVSNNIFRLPGQTFVSGLNGANWTKSARSVQTVSGIFTVVLRGGMFTYLGLNNEGNVPTYPAARFSRAKYAFVNSFQGFTPSLVSRPYELGVAKGSSRTWSSSEDVLTVAICDTGAAIEYKVSPNDGATWTTHYTSGATYVPNDVYRVDVGTIFGNQNVMVEVYPSVLV